MRQMITCVGIAALAIGLAGCGDRGLPGTYGFDMGASREAAGDEGNPTDDGYYYQGQSRLIPPKTIVINADGSGAFAYEGGTKTEHPAGAWVERDGKVHLNGKPIAIHSSGTLQLRMMLDASSRLVEPDDKSSRRNKPLIYEK